MATIRIDVNTKEVVVDLREVESRLEPRLLLDVFGATMYDSIRETFAQGGYPAGSWRLLHASSIAQSFSRRGVSTRTKLGKQKVGFLRFAAGKKILRDTDRLFGSITTSTHPDSVYEISGSKLTLGTNLVYAAIHQEGGVIVPRAARGYAASTNSGLLALFGGPRPNRRPPMLRIPLGDGRVIFRPKVTIPARPFLVVKPDDPDKMAAAGEAFITGGVR